MKTRINLLEGNILPALSALALPIMATSLIQMAYNLIDMIWIGKIGASAVASVGAAGMFMWLSNGLATLAKMGGQIKVGHALGAQKKEDAASYAQSSIQMGIVFAIGFGILSIVFADEMIGFFQLNSAQVIQDAKLYLMITCGLVIFSFMNQIFTRDSDSDGKQQNLLYRNRYWACFEYRAGSSVYFRFRCNSSDGCCGGCNCDSTCTAGGYAVVSVYHTTGYGLVL